MTPSDIDFTPYHELVLKSIYILFLSVSILTFDPCQFRQRMHLSGQTLIASSPVEPVSVSELGVNTGHQLGHFSSLSQHQLKFGNTLLMMSQSKVPTTSPPAALNGNIKSKSSNKKSDRESNSSPISVSGESNHSVSPSSSPFNPKFNEDDDERISVSSPVKSHTSPISSYSVPNHLAKMYSYSLGQHLPGQFPYPFGFPFPYHQQYDLSLANGLLSQNQTNLSNTQQQSNKQTKPSTNFSVASLLAGKDDDRKQSRDSKGINRNHNSSYSEGEEDEDEDIDEEMMEESASAAVAAATEDEDEEAVDMTNRNGENQNISVTRLTPSPPSHQLSPPNSRSVSPLSPNYLKSSMMTNGHFPKNFPHPMNVDSMSAALQLQLAAAAAARHRFTVDGMMLDHSATAQNSNSHPMFSPHGPHAHALLASGGLHPAGPGAQQTPTGWLPHPGAHQGGGLGGLPGGHGLNPFHWLSHTSGPLSPSQSKCHFHIRITFIWLCACSLA